VRDERVLRVQARDHDEVDDGWLCDKGRFAYQSIHVDERVTQPLVRDGGELRPVSWERALGEAASGLRRAAGRVGALAGGDASNEEGYLLARLLREGLGCGHLDTVAGIAPAELHHLADPELQATVPDLEFAHTVLVLGTEPVRDMAILDLRIRKGVRRHGVKLALATTAVSALDSSATLALRYAPGHDADFVQALAAALYGGDVEQHARECQADAGKLRALAELLRTGGEDVVILYGQGVLADPARATDAREALLKVARGLGLSGRAGAGLLAVPAAGANGRGLLEAGFAPGYGPGLRAIGAVGDGTNGGAAGTQAASGTGATGTQVMPDALDAHGIGAALATGELSALYLLNVDPLRCGLPREHWEAALERASTVIAHAGFLTEGLRAHANVVFPAESYAEKEGTVVHPDGRLQRLRPAIGRQGETRAGWSVICELARICGCDLEVLTGPMASQRLFDAVPFYAGLTLEEIGGRGVRWQERAAASAFPAPPPRPGSGGPARRADDSTGAAATPAVPATPAGSAASNGAGHFQPASLWSSPEVEFSPALKFLYRHGLAEARGAAVPADAMDVAATAAREGRPA